MGSYLRFDAGAGVTKRFTSVAVFIDSGVNATWSVQYSDNATDWTTVATGVGGHPTTAAKNYFGNWANAGAHRYWQLYKTDVAAGGNYHYEVQFYEGVPIGAIWGDSLANIPGTLQSPSGDGLYLSSTYMGFYQSSAWRSFMKNDGTFQFWGDADNYVSWNGTTLGVKGSIIITGGSGYANISDKPTALGDINSGE